MTDINSDYLNGELDHIIRNAMEEGALYYQDYRVMDVYDKINWINNNPEYDYEREVFTQ